MNPHKFMTTVVEALKDESITDIVECIAHIVRIYPPKKIQNFRIDKVYPHHYDIRIQPKIKVEHIKLKIILTTDSNKVVTKIATEII